MSRDQDIDASAVTAAQAVAAIRELDDPRGYEVFVPRAMTSAEVRRVRQIPQGVGWRYYPAAHGRRPCTCPACLQRGTFKVAKLRRRFPYDAAARCAHPCAAHRGPGQRGGKLTR